MKKFYRKMKMGERGFTLIELLVVVAILGILATLAIPRITVALDDAKDKKAKSDLAVINNALERYYFDNGKYPTKLGDLKGYVKGGFDYKNSYGKYYFYAVNYGVSNKVDYTEFVLGDPGKSPTDLGSVSWNNTTTSLPEGIDPTTGAYFWGSGNPSGLTNIGTPPTTKPARSDLLTD